MAGTYPDVPAPRMALDRDGSVVVHLQMTTSTVLGPLSTAQILELNDEGTAGGFQISINNQEAALCVIFPELRDLVGYYLEHPTATAITTSGIESSVNTTNGIDGTWTSRGAWSHRAVNMLTKRNNITLLSVSGIKAIRFRVNNTSVGSTVMECLHLYGGPSAGQNPDRLRLWHPTSDAEVGAAYFDWGDIAQLTSQDRPFRLKNNSATLTANTITVSIAAPTDPTPSVAGQHLLERASNPGFTATVVVASLAPGGISEVITLRRVTPVNALTSLWWARILASAASWT